VKLHEAVKKRRELEKMPVTKFAKKLGIIYSRYLRFEKSGYFQPCDLPKILNGINGTLETTLIIKEGDSETKIKID
jgi:hypothetical protein